MSSKRNSKSVDGPQIPHLTQGSVLDDLGFNPAEALELRVKAEIYRDLLQYIHERQYTPAELLTLLGIHQPDVSNLLNGRVSRFSVGKLIKLAGKLNLGAQIKLIKPKKGSLTEVDSPIKDRQRSSAVA